MTCFTRLLITARKRSLGQGNVFTPVCHSVHKERGSLFQYESQVTWLGRSFCPEDSLCPRGSLSGRPPYGQQWSLRVLLVCILVWRLESVTFYTTDLLTTQCPQFRSLSYWNYLWEILFLVNFTFEHLKHFQQNY